MNRTVTFVLLVAVGVSLIGLPGTAVATTDTVDSTTVLHPGADHNNESNSSDDDGLGFGIGTAIAGAGGAGYLLRRYSLRE